MSHQERASYLRRLYDALPHAPPLQREFILRRIAGVEAQQGRPT